MDLIALSKQAMVPPGIHLPPAVRNGMTNPDNNMQALEIISGTKGYKEGKPYDPNLPADSGYMEKFRNWSLSPRYEYDTLAREAMNAGGPVQNSYDATASTNGRKMLQSVAPIGDAVLSVPKFFANAAKDTAQTAVNDMPVRAMRIQKERIPEMYNATGPYVKSIIDEGGPLKYRDELPSNAQKQRRFWSAAGDLGWDGAALAAEGGLVGASTSGLVGLGSGAARGTGFLFNRLGAPVIQNAVEAVPFIQNTSRIGLNNSLGIRNNVARGAALYSDFQIAPLTEQGRYDTTPIASNNIKNTTAPSLLVPQIKPQTTP